MLRAWNTLGHPVGRVRFAFLMLVCVSSMITKSASGQTIRSTRYSGVGSGVYFADEARFDDVIPMTVEAWVYRENANRCETIISHNYFSSFWFGFCPRLRFYRSGAVYADSPMDVPAFQWTHVAATYDGFTVRFYIDGQQAGTVPLNNNPFATRTGNLGIGADVNCCLFQGNLDEVRLWSHPRSQAEVLEDMYGEPRSSDGLVAVFDRGGRIEAINSVAAVTATGITESSFGILPRELLVPRSPVPVVVDGYVNAGTEYAGAELFTLRYRNPKLPYASDIFGYLVHDDDNLYIGFGPTRFLAPGASYDASYVGVMLDPNHSGDESLQGNDFMVRSFLGAPAPDWLWGNSIFTGGWGSCGGLLAPPCPAAADWQAVDGVCGDDVGPLCREFRISRNRLGDFTQTHGLAVGHFGISANGHYAMAPSDASPYSPETWAAVSYSDNIVTLPTGRGTARVYDGQSGDRSRPIAGHSVFFGSLGSIVGRATDASGRADFDTIVPVGETVRLEVHQCSGCRLFPPQVRAGTGTAPSTTANHVALFPGCASGTCDYADIDFFLLRPPPPIQLTSMDPVEGWPETTLRKGPSPQVTPASEVTLYGANLHDQIEVALTRPNSDPDPANWWREPAAIVARDPGRTWVRVRVPQAAPGIWRWAVEDQWLRSGYTHWSFLGPFTVGEPPFPEFRGFGFANEEDSATLSDFFSVFGNNGYICVGLGLFGECLGCRVPDPLYFLYWPIYAIWTEASGGSCMGMSATALKMKRGALSPHEFNPEVHFPYGFNVRDPDGEYDWDLCGPPEPTNLWGEIRVNHGVQTSAECIDTVLVQLMDGDLFSFHGDPIARLNNVRFSPFEYALSMIPYIGTGHVVLPYAVEDIDPTLSRIWVYDNNDPGDTNRYIDIDLVNNRYNFPLSGDDWSGRGIFALPLSLFTESRSAPGIEEALLFIIVLVFGDADGHYTTADGGEWGWREDGSFVDALPGALSLSPLGPRDTPTRNVPLAIPVNHPWPMTQINNRGGDYRFHVAQGGTMVQVEVKNGKAGSTDQAEIGVHDGRLAVLNYAPQEEGTEFVPKVGMVLDTRKRAVFQWVGLEAKAGGSFGFTALHDRSGVEFRNDSGVSTGHRLVVDVVDGEEEVAQTLVFGPLTAHPGAAQCTCIETAGGDLRLHVENDFDRDGRTDEVVMVFPVTCGEISDEPLPDTNGDGIPDSCERAALGDFDSDGDVDGIDYAMLFRCLEGPETAVGLDCRNADLQRDGDVDLADYRKLLQCFAGSGQAASCP